MCLVKDKDLKATTIINFVEEMANPKYFIVRLNFYSSSRDIDDESLKEAVREKIDHNEHSNILIEISKDESLSVDIGETVNYKWIDWKKFVEDDLFQIFKRLNFQTAVPTLFGQAPLSVMFYTGYKLSDGNIKYS